MDAINTLHDFLTRAGTHYQIFDMGRRVAPITITQFADIEAGRMPYPTPRAGHAWIGILFWNAERLEEHFVWFLKLPLDERGLIAPAPRSQFIQTVLEGLGEDPAAAMSEEQQERLKQNPFTFTPPQEKMAQFHAQVRQRLVQPASAHFEPVRQYLSGQLPWGQWQHLGLQGFAEVMSRPGSVSEQQLVDAVEAMPAEPLAALAAASEHAPLPRKVAEGFARRSRTNPELKLYCLRALSATPEVAKPLVEALLAKHRLNQDELLTLAARLWDNLEGELMNQYLEHLAKYPGQFFNQLYADLVSIPGQRAWVLNSLSQASPDLAEAMRQLAESLKGATHA